MKKGLHYLVRFSTRIQCTFMMWFASTEVLAANEGLAPAKSSIIWVTNFVIHITLLLMVLSIIQKLPLVQTKKLPL